jgi:dihydrolipoamide dehydrogenase
MRFLAFTLLTSSAAGFAPINTRRQVGTFSALSVANGDFDFDVAVIGCGVGGHGAALHSRAQGLSTAVFAGGDVGGTCVNRGCVPSKALLAASGRVREMRDEAHLKSLGIEVEGKVTYNRQGIADHAKNLASKVKGNLENSLVGLGCNVIQGRGKLTGNPQEVVDEATGKVYKCKVCEPPRLSLNDILCVEFIAHSTPLTIIP